MKRVLTVLLQNLAVLAVFVLAVVLYGWWRGDENLVDRELKVRYQGTPAMGVLGEEVETEGVSVTVVSFERQRSTSVAAGVRLSSRARVDNLTDLVAVELRVRNRSDEEVSLDYHGTGQRADVRLGARRPSPRTALPLLPQDVRAIGRWEPLPSRVLQPGEEMSGALVFPMNRHAHDLALALVPERFLTAAEPDLPSFEISLEPGVP